MQETKGSEAWPIMTMMMKMKERQEQDVELPPLPPTPEPQSSAGWMLHASTQDAAPR